MEKQNLVEVEPGKNVEFVHYFLLLQKRMVVVQIVEHQLDVQQVVDEEILQPVEIKEFQEENQMLLEQMESI
jgi:hypothetical protein